MEEVSKALIHRYSKDSTDPPNVDGSEVSACLLELAEAPGPGKLLALIRSEHPEWQLDDLSIAILSSVDDCAKVIFLIMQMPPLINRQFRRALPRLASALVQSPDLPLTQDPAILVILDALNQGMVGWTEGLGAGSNKLHSFFEATIEKMLNPDTNLEALAAEVTAFMTKESDRTRRLEERLAASETGLVRSKQAKMLAANLINTQAENKFVTESLANFLRGPWNDSLQLLINQKGVESDDWQRAVALTETLLWTYQPFENTDKASGDNKQRLYQLIENLPQQIRQLLVSLTQGSASIETALENIEMDQVAIVSGHTPEFVEFVPIASEIAVSQSKVSRVLLRKVTPLTPGQWFSYTEGNDVKLIKLVLKLDDVQQLLFTNRNGMKVMQKSFDEFAYDLSSNIVKSINSDAAFSSTFNTFYQGLVSEFHNHRERIAERRAEVDRLDEERKKAKEKALAEAKQLKLDKEEADRSRREALKKSRLANADAVAKKPENAELVTKFTDIVAGLSAGAVVLLHDALGVKQECKLAVRITAANKLIFVDRNGLKAGDYQSEQLVALLVVGDAEIGEQGVEFEDTLAAVVTKLRSDREKSYDDLTGT